MTYEYHCQECDARILRVYPMGEFPREVPCECGGEASKVLEVVDFHLKGGGWTNGYDGGVGEAPSATNHKTSRNARTEK